MHGSYTSKGILKETFTDFLDLPYLITEQLWKLIDSNAKGFLSCDDFANFFGKLTCGSIRDKISIIFQMYSLM